MKSCDFRILADDYTTTILMLFFGIFVGLQPSELLSQILFVGVEATTDEFTR